MIKKEVEINDKDIIQIKLRHNPRSTSPRHMNLKCAPSIQAARINPTAPNQL